MLYMTALYISYQDIRTRWLTRFASSVCFVYYNNRYAAILAIIFEISSTILISAGTAVYSDIFHTKITKIKPNFDPNKSSKRRSGRTHELCHGLWMSGPRVYTVS